MRLPIRRARVTGASMEPTLADGEVVLVSQWGRRDRLATPGTVVLVEDPRRRSRLLIKRVLSVAAGGATIRGDNQCGSTDSRAFGPVPLDHVRGRVLGA